ncbi:MAG TPA: VOC family protein [Candidatus Limnocylindria bacterium]|nr:VOC family protein [Candidatus Limnocylindria bacterium]
MTIAINSLTVDSHDPRAVARFWSAVLDWPVLHESDDQVLIAPFEERHPGVFPVLFLKNPDDKRVKNRWHFDLAPADQAAEVARLEALGARRADIGQGGVDWVVMADVEGNEFCVLRSLPKEEQE